MCNKLELIYSSFFSTIGSVLYLASTKNPRLWQLSESVWYKAAHWHKSPSHRDFSRTTLQTPALLRLNIFSETKHYFLLRNSCLLTLKEFLMGDCFICSRSNLLLPPQGFGPEAKTRGGTLEPPACIHIRNFKNVKM